MKSKKQRKKSTGLKKNPKSYEHEIRTLFLTARYAYMVLTKNIGLIASDLHSPIELLKFTVSKQTTCILGTK